MANIEIVNTPLPDIIELKEQVANIQMIIQEDFELADDVIMEIETSRERPEKDFISHEDMKKEFD